jgi:hypothetical protein
MYFPLPGIKLQLVCHPTRRLRRLVAKGCITFTLRSNQATTSSTIPLPKPIMASFSSSIPVIPAWSMGYP